MKRTSPRVLAILAVAVGAMSCVPAPRAPIDLQKAEAKTIRLGLRHPRSAICPGEPVELDFSMEVDTDDGDRFHVVARRVDIDDAIFDPSQLYLSSPQGRFEDGVFYPAEDARLSLGTGFVFYARAPRGPAFSVRFPPYYECDGYVGGEGKAGVRGRDDAIGVVGKPLPGLDRQALAGDEVGDRVDGGAGGVGPKLTVYVTWVRTADYSKLLAARSVGDIDMLSFSAPGYPLDVVARGGHGGDGGRGRQGATGGGAGSAGGSGGPGGDGGELEVVVDERFPELESSLRIDVRGGDGGRGGSPGPGGEREMRQVYRRRKGGGRSATGDWVPNGPRGVPGPSGSAGARGADGRFVIRSGEAASQFAGVGALAAY